MHSRRVIIINKLEDTENLYHKLFTLNNDRIQAFNLKLFIEIYEKINFKPAKNAIDKNFILSIIVN